MSTFDWPEALVPQTCHMPLVKAGLQFQSPFNGTLQALDFVAERWALSANLAQMTSRNPRGVGAFLNQLSGGVNRVRAWPFHTKGVPRGTLRGTPTLGAAAARGDLTLTLAGGTGVNLLAGSSFEVDTNADGLANSWSTVAGGTTGAVTYSRIGSGATHGAYKQRVTAAGLGTTTSDLAGVSQTVPVTANMVYALSAYVGNPTGTVQAGLYIDWKDAASAVITSASNYAIALTGSLVRSSLIATAPPAAAFATVYVFVHSRSSGVGLATMDLDAVQMEAAVAATAYAPGPTLFSDDYIGAGGQIFQVASDCAASDAGAMVVPVVNRVRGTIASGSAVTWHKPTAEFVMPAMQAAPVFRPGAIDAAALDLLEAW